GTVMRSINFQCLQVAHVDANDGCSDCGGPLDFFNGMRFDQSVHTKFMGQCKIITELCIIERSDNQEHQVCVVGTSFIDLILVDGEVLAQQWNINACSHGGKAPHGACTSSLCRQQRHRSRSPGGVLCSKISWRTDVRKRSGRG